MKTDNTFHAKLVEEYYGIMFRFARILVKDERLAQLITDEALSYYDAYHIASYTKSDSRRLIKTRVRMIALAWLNKENMGPKS